MWFATWPSSASRPSATGTLQSEKCSAALPPDIFTMRLPFSTPCWMGFSGCAFFSPGKKVVSSSRLQLRLMEKAEKTAKFDRFSSPSLPRSHKPGLQQRSALLAWLWRYLKFLELFPRCHFTAIVSFFFLFFGPTNTLWCTSLQRAADKLN